MMQIKIQHLICECPILKLPSINNHRGPINSCTMVFPRKDIQTLCLHQIMFLLLDVVNSDLICALSDLPFLVEHETATKTVDLVLESSRLVSASTL